VRTRLFLKSKPDWQQTNRRAMRLFKQLELIFRDADSLTRRLQRLSLPKGEGWGEGASKIHRRSRDVDLEMKARKLLRELNAAKLAREIRVEWNPRLKTAAGRADFREKLISLNPCLRDHGQRDAENQLNLECNKHSSLTNEPYPRAAVDTLECNMHSSLSHDASEILENSGPRRLVVLDEIDRTLRHELAHLLAQFRVGRRRIAPHGPEWREACRDLDIADEGRCHNLPFASKSFPRRYVYRCPNCRQKFPRVRRIRRAIACLACCRAHNRGEFDVRFRLRLIRSPQKGTKETKNPKNSSSFTLLSSV
jgi:predicted SprT family Zn-dependent metalloprotease